MSAAGEPPLIHVVAGVLRDAAGRVLFAQRPAGKDMAGKWELPGGKLHAGEGLHEALERELAEELGIKVAASRPLLQLTHRYPHRHVALYAREVTAFHGAAHGREGQALAWVAPAHISRLDLLEADGPIVTAITLPDRYLLTPPLLRAGDDVARFVAEALGVGIGLLALRLPGMDRRGLDEAAAALAAAAAPAGLRWLVHGEPPAAVALARRHGAAGVHLPARCLPELAAVRGVLGATGLVAVSCHGRGELEAASTGGADFAVLGPVRETASHPGVPGRGWPWLERCVRDLPMPVYAIGGMRRRDLPAAWEAGAQGVAGITGIAGAAAPAASV